MPKGQELLKARELLKAGVAYVQPNYLYQTLRIPDDPLYRQNQRISLETLLGLEAAWSVYNGDPELIIAVTDTGYQAHEDMGRWYLPQGQMLDVSNNDTDPTDDLPAFSAKNHGLEVASVLGASTNNGQGMAAVAWAGKVLPLKVANSQSGEITTTSLAQAIGIATDLGAKVINISLGSEASDKVLENAILDARNRGVTVVAAAGNDGRDGILYPARSSAVISVGSVDNDRTKSSFSNCGPELDLVAPGRGVVVVLPNDDYGQASGTSFASPMVAGVAALYIGRYHALKGVWPSPDQVYACLTGTAEDLGPVGKDDEYGFGLVRADRVMTDTTYCFP
ncbi:S8 family serine peptidase [Thermus tenuipuniceus]|uniref:S8 family serine peptidase n=1 Tax=Thermus tenuipuniceus TaxID=2078690 RepID=UPI00313452F8